ANIGVFGHSGAGKTYLLSTLAMGALGRGTQVLIIDPEHEYGSLARQLGGVDVELALGSGHALNVLDLKPSDRRDEAWLGPAAADAVDLCACVCGALDESERALVFEDATIRRFVVSLARRIRKYDGSLVFATQNPGDLLSSDQGAVVATNPALVFFGAQRPGEAAKLQVAFHLSPQQRGLLE